MNNPMLEDFKDNVRNGDPEEAGIILGMLVKEIIDEVEDPDRHKFNVDFLEELTEAFEGELL